MPWALLLQQRIIRTTTVMLWSLFSNMAFEYVGRAASDDTPPLEGANLPCVRKYESYDDISETIVPSSRRARRLHHNWPEIANGVR